MSKKITQQINDISIAYASDLSLQYFEKIEHLPWAMLLRSPLSEHSDSRYDILVAKPVATLISKNTETEVTTPEGRYITTSDRLHILVNVQ